MKLKYNKLCEENFDLKSQLDTIHMQSKENRKQVESDEMKLKYNLLYEENANLKSELDIIHKQSKKNRKLVEKYKELKGETQHDGDDLVCLICNITIKQDIFTSANFCGSSAFALEENFTSKSLLSNLPTYAFILTLRYS